MHQGRSVNAHGIKDGADEEYYRNLEEGELKDYQHQELKNRESDLSKTRILTPASFWPMLAEVPSQEQAQAILEHMWLTYSQYDPHTIWECYNPTKPAATASGTSLSATSPQASSTTMAK